MRKAPSTNKILLAFTLLFMLVAAFSFAAFTNTEKICSEAKTCTQSSPSQKGGEMLWDGFSRRFVSLVTIR